MVDFGELKDKAQDLVAQHADTVKGGITKAGDFIGDKVGHDKLNPIEDKLHDLVDKAAGKDDDVPPPVDLNETPVATPPRWSRGWSRPRRSFTQRLRPQSESPKLSNTQA